MGHDLFSLPEGAREKGLVVACHQPSLFPWAGWWAKYLACDEFVFLEGVRLPKGELNRVRAADGTWITLPISRGDGSLIKDIMVRDEKLVRKVARTIEQRYAATRRRYRHRVLPVVQSLHTLPRGALVEPDSPPNVLVLLGRKRAVSSPNEPA